MFNFGIVKATKDHTGAWIVRFRRFQGRVSVLIRTKAGWIGGVLV